MPRGIAWVTGHLERELCSLLLGDRREALEWPGQGLAEGELERKGKSAFSEPVCLRRKARRLRGIGKNRAQVKGLRKQQFEKD